MAANYPDWVMKYKTKGVYVNKRGDTYYLYRAHSERVPGTKKVKRVSDGYIGKVTEKDGFVPVKDKVQEDVTAYDYGMYFFLSVVLENPYKGFKRRYRKKADTIMSLGILKYLNITPDFYENTGLFSLYPKTDIKWFTDKDVMNESDRLVLMANSLIDKIDKQDWQKLKEKLPMIHIVKINGKFYISSHDDDLEALLNKYDTEVFFDA